MKVGWMAVIEKAFCFFPKEAKSGVAEVAHSAELPL